MRNAVRLLAAVGLVLVAALAGGARGVVLLIWLSFFLGLFLVIWFFRRRLHAGSRSLTNSDMHTTGTGASAFGVADAGDAEGSDAGGTDAGGAGGFDGGGADAGGGTL